MSTSCELHVYCMHTAFLLYVYCQIVEDTEHNVSTISSLHLVRTVCALHVYCMYNLCVPYMYRQIVENIEHYVSTAAIDTTVRTLVTACLKQQPA